MAPVQKNLLVQWLSPLRRVAAKLGEVVSYGLIALVWLSSVPLMPWRIGRLLRTVSLPRMREHRVRTSLTVLGVALGVAVLVAVVTVNHSIVRGTAATFDDLAGRADLQVSGGEAGIDESLLDVVRSVQGVYKLTPVVQQIVNVHREGGARERVLMLGVDLLGSEDSHFRSYASQELAAIKHDPLDFLNSSTNMILSRQLAERLHLKLHDKLSVTTSHGLEAFEIWGFIEDEGVGRAFGGAIAVMYYPAMQVAFARGRNISRIDIAVHAGQDVATVQESLQAALGSGFRVERPSLRGDRVSKMLMAMRAGLNMASFVALVAGVFLVFNTCAIGVVQRKRELGILRALGISRSQLARLLTLEGALLGIAGAALGILFGLVISRAMLRLTSHAVSEIYVEQSVDAITLDPWLIAGAFAAGIVSSALAARLATHRASGVHPVEALSSAAVSMSGSAPVKGFTRSDLTALGLSLVSLALLALPPYGNAPVGALGACVLLTFAMQALLPRLVQVSHRLLLRLGLVRMGAALSLAVQNLPRNPGRVAGMASGLMAGVSLTVSVATFVASFITSVNGWTGQLLPGDLFVTSGSSAVATRNLPMDDALRAQLLAIPGVAQVRRIRLVETRFRDATIKLGVSEFRALFKDGSLILLEGERQPVLRALESGALVVSENFSRTFSVHRGDSVELATARGTRAFEVAGVVVDYSSDIGAVLMDYATYKEGWSDDRVDTYELRVAPGVDPQAVRRTINDRLSEKHDLFVLTNGEFRRSAVKAADQIFVLLQALEIITLLVAALGLMTTVLANVMDRVREIGMLRALGMHRSQVSTMIVAETVVVGGIGTVAGVVLGSALGYIALTRITSVLVGWHLPYQIPFAVIGQLTLVTLAISVVAGMIPARQAASLVVRDALDRE